MFSSTVAYYIINSPPLIYKEFHIWALVTAPFASVDPFMMLFGLCSFIPRGSIEERMKGTAYYIIHFFWLSVLSQILMVALFLGVSLMVDKYQAVSAGLWTMAILTMSLDSFRNPDQAMNLCLCPIQIKAKYCPYIWLAIFFFFIRVMFLSIFAGYLVAAAYHFGYLGFTEPTQRCMQWLEAKVLSSYVNSPSYVSSTMALNNPGDGGAGGGLPMFLRQQQPPPQPSLARPGEPRGDTNQPAQFKPFPGKGVSLGSDMGTNAPGAQGAAVSGQQNIRDVPSAVDAVRSPPKQGEERKGTDDSEDDKPIGPALSGDELV